EGTEYDVGDDVAIFLAGEPSGYECWHLVYPIHDHTGPAVEHHDGLGIDCRNLAHQLLLIQTDFCRRQGLIGLLTQLVGILSVRVLLALRAERGQPDGRRIPCFTGCGTHSKYDDIGILRQLYGCCDVMTVEIGHRRDVLLQALLRGHGKWRDYRGQLCRIPITRRNSGRTCKPGVTDQRYRLHLRRVQRQQTLLVLEQHDTGFRQRARLGSICLEINRKHAVVAVIEEPELVHLGVTGQEHRVDVLLRYLTRSDGGLDVFLGVVHRLLIELVTDTRQQGVHRAVHGTPVALDPAIEAPAVTQGLLQQLFTVAR